MPYRGSSTPYMPGAWPAPPGARGRAGRGGRGILPGLPPMPALFGGAGRTTAGGAPTPPPVPPWQPPVMPAAFPPLWQPSIGRVAVTPGAGSAGGPLPPWAYYAPRTTLRPPYEDQPEIPGKKPPLGQYPPPYEDRPALKGYYDYPASAIPGPKPPWPYPTGGVTTEPPEADVGVGPPSGPTFAPPEADYSPDYGMVSYQDELASGEMPGEYHPVRPWIIEWHNAVSEWFKKNVPQWDALLPMPTWTFYRGWWTGPMYEYLDKALEAGDWRWLGWAYQAMMIMQMHAAMKGSTSELPPGEILWPKY